MFFVAVAPVHATLVCVPIDDCALRNCFRLHIEHISSCTFCSVRSSRRPSAGFSSSIATSEVVVMCSLSCFRDLFLSLEHVCSRKTSFTEGSREDLSRFFRHFASDLVSCRTSEGRQRPDLIIASSVRSVTIRPHSPTFNIVVVDLTLTHRFLHDDHDVNFTVTYSGVSTRLHESDQFRVSQAAALHRRAATL